MQTIKSNCIPYAQTVRFHLLETQLIYYITLALTQQFKSYSKSAIYGWLEATYQNQPCKIYMNTFGVKW